MHHTVNVPRPPATAVRGRLFPRNGMLNGVWNGRARSGSLKRSATTEMCAVVNEIMAPNAYSSASSVVLPGRISRQATVPKAMIDT